MSCIINCHKISKRYSFKPLFEDLSLSIHEKDRIGLIGNNGTGKSTLLKILVGIEDPDTGQCIRSKGIKIAYVPQFPHFEDKPPLDILIQSNQNYDPNIEFKAKTLLSIAGLDANLTSCHKMSGGQKKKLDILRGIILEPDILFLDEPTNHLDLESVLWLEDFLKKFQKTLVIVSHDRYFLNRVCSQFIEISPMYPNGNFQATGSLEEFFEKKELWIEGETKRAQALSHKVEHEIAWMKRSPKARTTKSVFRTKEALKLEGELKTLKSNLRTQAADIELNSSERQTRLLISGKNLTKSLGGKLLFKGLDLILSPGKRIGLLGPNGCGKTTLFKILARTLEPDSGTIKFADNLKVVLFDQHKMQLCDTDSVKDALCPSGEFVDYQGQKIHVNGWAKRFAFTQDTLRLPVKKLSGGERSRLLIAKLMLEPADVLLLDEPTNDLDIQTLEILEDALIDFSGCVMIISHDRYFLSAVCDQFLALGDKPEGVVYQDYSAWENRQIIEPKKAPKEEKPKSPKASFGINSKQARELKNIQIEIETLEKKAKELEEDINLNSDQKDLKTLNEKYALLGSYHSQIEKLFLRWEELDQIQRS